MGLLKRGTNQKVLLIDKSCNEFEIKTLTRDGNILKEIISDREYTITEGPIINITLTEVQEAQVDAVIQTLEGVKGMYAETVKDD